MLTHNLLQSFLISVAMLHVYLVTIICLVTSCCPTPTPTRVWTFNQPLDHYTHSPESNRTVPQRVFEYDMFWRHGEEDGGPGPMFVYTGNECPIDLTYSNTGFLFESAPKFGALIVYIEHRYYGQSLPFGNQSFTTPALKYLTTTQATADYARVIDWYRKKYNISQVVTFGGSYGGMLSAWMRLRFPQLVNIAVASSAPVLLAVGHSQINKTFYEAVTETYERANDRCPDIVRSGFAKLHQLVEEMDSEKVTKAFSLCHKFNTSQFEHLVGWVRNALGMMAMQNYPYSSNFFGDLPPWPVKTACSIMLSNIDAGKGELTALAQGAGLFYNGTSGKKDCFDIFEEYIECADITGCGTGPDGEAWDWQSCTDLQFKAPTNNITDMFPPLDWNYGMLNEYCLDKFGVIPNPSDAILAAWSADFSSASNIIFINGLSDPWHVGGILSDINPAVRAIKYEGGAHCFDLKSTNTEDFPSVTIARNKVIALLKNWIV